jgi:hypothetical protein
MGGEMALGVVQLVAAVVAGLILLLGLLGARFCCRRRCGSWRFALCFLIGTIVATFALSLPFFAFAVVHTVAVLGVDELWQMTAACVTQAAVFGLALGALVLPFLVLSFTSGFYGERFRRSLRLPQAGAGDVPRANGGECHEANTAP